MTRFLLELADGDRTLRVLEPWPDGTCCVASSAPAGEDRWCYVLHAGAVNPLTGESAPVDRLTDPQFVEALGEAVSQVVEQDMFAGPFAERLVAAFGVPWDDLTDRVVEQLRIVVGAPALVLDEVQRESPEELRTLRHYVGNDLAGMVFALRAIALYRTERMGEVGR